jgi:hypothetical protein
VTLHSIFASRKRSPAEDEKLNQTSSMLPSNFQVYAKIDEESRKDNYLAASFLLTLNDARGLVTYEFRGICNISGSSSDFESVMEAHKDSRVPKILDIVYQRVYPAIFMLAGMTSSAYPQSIALLTEMVSSEPIAVHQEATTASKDKEKVQETVAAPKEKEKIQATPEAQK